MSKIPPCDTCGAVERSGASWKDTRDSPSKALGTRGAVLGQSPNGDPSVGIKPDRHFVVRFGPPALELGEPSKLDRCRFESGVGLSLHLAWGGRFLRPPYKRSCVTAP